MGIRLGDLTTEQQNESTKNIDTLDTIEMLRLFNKEDAKIIAAVEAVLPQIALAVDLTSERLKAGGRLFYVGAGTSGRLGVLDAVECPPTFSTEPQMVQGIIAGGDEAFFKAVEGAEDSLEQGKQAIENYGITDKDVVVGITASGRTPFVMGILQEAKAKNISCIGISNNANSPINEFSDIAIAPIVGPEVIIGSTRLKAGTSQKLVLNMISTASMIKLGKVFGNLMVDLMPTNEKLVARAIRIISQATGVDAKTAEDTLYKADKNAKLAITMILTNRSKEEAKTLLADSEGFISKALDNLKP